MGDLILGSCHGAADDVFFLRSFLLSPFVLSARLLFLANQLLELTLLLPFPFPELVYRHRPAQLVNAR